MREKCPYCHTGHINITSVPPKLKHQDNQDGSHEQLSRRYISCSDCGASGYMDAYINLKPPADLSHHPLQFEFKGL